MQTELLIERLNSKSRLIRHLAIVALKKRERLEPGLAPQADEEEAALNIHTHYSFSPYSPAQAAYSAYKRAVKLACVCDYATVSGVREFFAECKYLGIVPLAGVEITALEGETPYSVSLYGLCEKDCRELEPFLREFRESRALSAKNATEQINRRFKKAGVFIDFDKDVLEKVKSRRGASVTYKHIYYAMGEKLIEKYGQGKPLADFVRYKLCVDVQENEYNLLCDGQNPFYIYDLVLALRANLHFSTGEGLPALSEVIENAANRGLIIACEFKSTSGWLENAALAEKSRAEFEAFVKKAKELGFNAVCLSHKRATEKTLADYVEILEKNEMLALPLERIEYPRSKFENRLPEPLKSVFSRSAYAVAGNAASAEENEGDGLFSPKTVQNCPDFSQRVGIFAAIGKRL